MVSCALLTWCIAGQGYLVFTAFVFAMFFSLLQFQHERRGSCLDRGFSAGLKARVVVLANVLLFLVLVLVQVSRV